MRQRISLRTVLAWGKNAAIYAKKRPGVTIIIPEKKHAVRFSVSPCPHGQAAKGRNICPIRR